MGDDRDRARTGVEVVAELGEAGAHVRLPSVSRTAGGRRRRTSRVRRTGSVFAPSRRGSSPDHGWPSRKNGRRASSATDRVGEEEDDDEVEDRRQAQGEGEAAHVRRRQHVEHEGGEEVDAVGGEDGALGAVPPGLDRALQRAALAQLVADPLEVHDEAVRGEPDGDDEAGDAGHVEPVVVRPAEDGHHEVGEQRREAERGDGHQAEQPVLDHRVDDDEQQADRGRR